MKTWNQEEGMFEKELFDELLNCMMKVREWIKVNPEYENSIFGSGNDEENEVDQNCGREPEDNNRWHEEDVCTCEGMFDDD